MQLNYNPTKFHQNINKNQSNLGLKIYGANPKMSWQKEIVLMPMRVRGREGEERTKERPKSETFKTAINTKKLWALNTILSATSTYQNSIN